MTTIAIHQPNFMPWGPFFEKMMRCDIFVLLYHCQFEKNNYQNRFFMDDHWYTMSVSKKTEMIIEKKYLNPFEDWQKILRKLPQYDYFLSRLTQDIDDQLWATNTRIIKRIADFLNIHTVIVNDYMTSLTGTDRLVDICKTYEADTYLSGPSGKEYLDISKFEKEGIQVKFHENKIKEPILKCLTVL